MIEEAILNYHRNVLSLNFYVTMFLRRTVVLPIANEQSFVYNNVQKQRYKRHFEYNGETLRVGKRRLVHRN